MLSCSIWVSALSFWMGGGLGSSGWCRALHGLLNVPDTTYEPIPLFHIPVDSLKNPGLMSKYLMTFLNIPDHFYITPFRTQSCVPQSNI